MNIMIMTYCVKINVGLISNCNKKIIIFLIVISTAQPSSFSVGMCAKHRLNLAIFDKTLFILDTFIFCSFEKH